MNRIELKKEARTIINNNLWNINKPLLILMVISSAFAYWNHPIDSTEGASINALTDFLTLPLNIGYSLYLLNFIRGLKYEVKDIFKPYKNLFKIVAVYFLIGLQVLLGTLLFIVPGIVLGLAYSKVGYFLAEDNNIELGIFEILRQSRKQMDGHKMDYFVLQLSFLGWILLSIPTFGLLLIWVLPYINITNTLYYEKLK